MPRKLHKVSYYDAKAILPPKQVFQQHDFKCPLCKNYNAKQDKCMIFDLDNIITRKRQYIVFCWKFEEGVYVEPIETKPKIVRRRRVVYIIVGKIEGMPILQIRQKPKPEPKRKRKIYLGGRGLV